MNTAGKEMCLAARMRSAVARACFAVVRSCPGSAIGILVFLCALQSPVPVGAAALEWKSLPDRERITLRLQPTEGIAGRTDRVAPNAVLVPFTSMPSGLLVNDTPEGAKLFQKTMAMGRALAIVTQTPEFGFIASGQNRSELVIDFFPNPLGARWKRTAPATVTEIAPDRDLQPISPPDAVTEALRTDPGGQGAQSRSLDETPSAATPSPAAAPPIATPPIATPPAGPAVATPLAAAQSPAEAPAAPFAAPPPVAPTTPPPVAPAAPSPVAPAAPTAGASALPPDSGATATPGAPALLGTPEHALRATRMGEAPPPASPRRSELPGPDGNVTPRAGAEGAGEQASSAARPFELYLPPLPEPEAAPPPVQAQTAQPFAQAQAQTRQAPASMQSQTPQAPVSTQSPVPQVPVQVRGGQAQEQVPLAPAYDQREAAAQSPVPQVPVQVRGGQAQEQVPLAPAYDQGEAAAQSPVPQVPVQVREMQPQARQASAPTQAQAPRTQLPGVGVPSRGSVYSGSINTEGPEALGAAFSQQNAAGAQVAPPAGPARAEIPAPAGSPPASAPLPQAAQSSTPSGAAQPAASSSAAQAQNGQAGSPAQDDAPVIVYTDDQGNPIEPPPEYPIVHPQIVENMKAGKFEEALTAVDDLLEKATLDHEQRGNLLHARSETLFALYKDAVPEHFQELYDAAVKAANYDPDSRLNAAEYLRLGYMNLRMNNPAEAEANFNMVRRRFPDMDNVALTYYYWGDYHYGRNELQKAADQFQHLIREYPNSRYTREASIGLARSLYRMGYYDQAWSVVDYINRRWEHFYIQYPPFLNMTADTAYRLGNKEEALKNYWLYVNLEPFGKEADIIMTRIGDIYAAKNEKKAAREAYLESAVRYPDKDGGLVAMMRMAEEGIHDNPTVADMFTVFGGPFNLSPQEVYRNIIEKHPDSSLAPVAEMKLALWHLWNKDYDKTLELLGDFLKKHPDHELAPRAREIAQQAFAVLAAEGAVDGRGTMLRELWERYPIVRTDPEAMNPESRLALALSYRSQGKPDEALRLVEPFFLGDMLPGYSDTALSMVLGIYLQYEQWNAVKEVAKRVEFWNLPAENRRQLDYAAALAEENLGETDAAAERWQRLYDSGALSPAQHAYAAFFLAMGAERGRRLEQAYHLGREALSGLEEQMQRAPDPADAAKIRTLLASLMDVTESAGRLRESLAYADRYLNSLPEGDPERLAVRYRVARIHKSQGDAEAWKSMLTEISAEAPDSVYGKLAASELKAAAIAEDAARYSPTGRL